MSLQPSAALGQARPDLADGLEEFDLEANRAGYVGMEICPVIEVPHQNGVFPKRTLAQILKSSEDTRRASGSAYRRGGGEFTKDNWNTEERGFEEPVDARENAINRDWFDAELIAADECRQQVLEDIEEQVIALVNAVSNTTGAGTAWSTHATADPTANVLAGKVAMRNRCGIVPNAMCVEWSAFQDLLECDAILDRIKHWGGDDPKKAAMNNLSLMAAVFDVERFVVAGAIKNTANEMAAASISTVFPEDKVLLYRHSDNRNMKRPRWANTLHWGEDGSRIGCALETYDDPAVRSEIVRARSEIQIKEIYADCAQVITGV
jgi:hypothetical protein